MNEFAKSQPAAPSSIESEIYPIEIGVQVFLILCILVVLINWVRKLLAKAKFNNSNVKESEELKNALRNWQPIVAESFETHRDVKIFSNLARAIHELCEKKTNKTVRNLVGLTALVTIGEVTIEELSTIEQSYSRLRVPNFVFLNPNLKDIEFNQKNENFYCKSKNSKMNWMTIA